MTCSLLPDGDSRDLKSVKQLSTDRKAVLMACIRVRCFKEEESNLKEKLEIARNMLIELPLELANLCAELSKRRNSLNHFGYSNVGGFTWKKLDEDLKSYYNEFCRMINVEP